MNGGYTSTVNFLPGSVTSVSADGLSLPYGGTSDGLTYYYNGQTVTYTSLFNQDVIYNNVPGTGATTYGIQIGATQAVDIESGATLDVAGGGTLTGAGFIQGAGGSIDVLKSPLVDANPTNPGAKIDNVYAIVPSYTGSYAPFTPDASSAGDGQPLVGEQVTIAQGIPGLPAGTYTLLPSSYALQPGAFRVEIGGTATTFNQSTAAQPSGIYEITGTLGTANTGTHNALASQLYLMAADPVRTYSQYDETTYSQFALAQVAQFGTIRPMLPIDDGVIGFDFANYKGYVTGNPEVLTMGGTLLDTPAQADGVTGATATVLIETPQSGVTEIRPEGQTATAGDLSLTDTTARRFQGCGAGYRWHL